MDDDLQIDGLTQLSLFEWGSDKEALELFPAVWGAMEALLSSDPAVRGNGLTRLEELKAARISPLVTYMLATRLGDADIRMRRRIVRILANVFKVDDQGRIAPDTVRHVLKVYLGHMRTRQIFDLLQVVVFEENVLEDVAGLLNACPYAGNHLVEILADRKQPMAMRIQAARMIGRVGYTDTIPVLEHTMARLEAKANGQQAMPFAQISDVDEVALLPSVREALTSLLAP
jgi:hypothetical protein